MAFAETITYRVIDSNRLNASQHSAIDDLLRHSLHADFPERQQGEINGLVQESSTNRGNPNKAGGTTARRRQSFAQSVNVLAIDKDGRLLAHLPAADNATSQVFGKVPEVVSDVVGAGLRQAKLHVPEVKGHGELLMKRRWLWLGLCGLNETARDAIAEADKAEVNIIDGLLAAAALRRHNLQPVAAYPYDGEYAWKRGLAWAGFLPVPSSRMQITAFGTKTDDVYQEKWTLDSVADLREQVAAKAGAEQLFSQIQPRS